MFALKLCALAACWLPLLLCQDAPAAVQRQQRGVMDGFGEGLKVAGQMFGVNTAADVANLVAKAFSGVAVAASERPQLDFAQIFQQLRGGPATTDDREAEPQAQEPQAQASAPPSPPPQPQSTSAKQEETLAVNFDAPSLVRNVLRMIGFDASKLGALAINALIMIAQAIGSTLMAATRGPTRFGDVGEGGRYQAAGSDGDQHSSAADDQPRRRQLRRNVARQQANASSNNNAAAADRPLDWFLPRHDANGDAASESTGSAAPDMNRLLAHAVDANLADRLVNMIAEMERPVTAATDSGGEAACLKMLMCKSSPFIWGMQRALQARYGNGTAVPRPQPDAQPHSNDHQLFGDLPSLAEYRQHGRVCERRFAQRCVTSKRLIGS